MYNFLFWFERYAHISLQTPVSLEHVLFVEAELREALPHLLMAEADYSRLSMFEATSDVQWLLMVVFHNLGMKAEEEAVLERYSISISTLRSFEECTLDEEVQQVWELVTDVGVSLAAR